MSPLAGGEGMTMLVWISVGAGSLIQPPFLILKNKGCNYSIKRVADDIPGLCYHSGVKGWISRFTMVEWASDDRELPHLPNAIHRVFYIH